MLKGNAVGRGVVGKARSYRYLNTNVARLEQQRWIDKAEERRKTSCIIIRAIVRLLSMFGGRRQTFVLIDDG